MKSLRVSSIPPTIVALLMMLNGIVNIVYAMLPVLNLHSGDLSKVSNFIELLPAQQANTMLTVIFGIILITVGLGLYHRKRTAWWWALIMLLLLIMSSSYPDLREKTLALAAVSLIILIGFRRYFNVRNNRMQADQLIAWTSVIFAFAYGIVGSYLLRHQYSNLHTWIDAVYYTVVTYSTTGYGDITPITANAKVFTVSMILVGLGAFATAITVLLGPMIERRIKGVFKIMNRFSSAKKHTIICGFNALTEYLAEELSERGIQCVFIEPDADQSDAAKDAGYDVLTADPTNLKVLQQASINHASNIICGFIDDAKNILTTMTVHNSQEKRIGKSLNVLVRIEKPENTTKAKQVGATDVIAPAVLGAELIAKQIL